MKFRSLFTDISLIYLLIFGEFDRSTNKIYCDNTRQLTNKILRLVTSVSYQEHSTVMASRNNRPHTNTEADPSLGVNKEETKANQAL